MDMFYFVEFGKLKHVHHTVNTYSGFQWATTLSSEKADLVMIHLLVVTAFMGIPAHVKKRQQSSIGCLENETDFAY